MIRLHAKAGLLGEGQVTTREIPWRQGLTARHLFDGARAHLPRSVEVGLAVNGRRLRGGELDVQLQDGAEVVVGAVPDGIEIGTMLVYALVAAFVSTAVSYVASLLMPKPKPAGVPQDRGDDSSATYSWSGVQTQYGQGFPVPFVYGRHRVGGQVIYTDVFAGANTGSTGGVRELLRLALALGEGPMHRVGDTVLAERDGLGGLNGDPPGLPIPSEIRVNQNLLDHTAPQPGVKVWLRPGSMNQGPLPSNPFRGATTVFGVSTALNEDNAQATFTYSGTDMVSAAAFVLVFPAGIYAQDNSGNLVAAPVDLEFSWRYSGETSWRNLWRSGTANTLASVRFGSVPSAAPVAGSLGGDFLLGGGAVAGPLELRVRRLPGTPAPTGTQVVSQCTWRQAAVNINQQLAYPRVALLGLELEATGRLQGSLPELSVLVDGLLVRVWDSTLGWSPRCWDVPAAPFNWMQRAPGRNPAWIALDFLLSPWGLGEWLTEDHLDLEAFRRWSIFCDQDPNPSSPWGEAAFCCDLVGDSPRPAWEVLLAICSAGRAVPVMNGQKISVIYQYRDAHSDALVTVPAKAAVQLFTSGNVQDLQVTWMPKASRPTAIQFQFLNEDKLHAQDVLTVEDSEGTLNDPTAYNGDQWRPEVAQAYGVTRESQLRREGLVTHRMNRLVRREVTFRTGPWALALHPGDLFELEHDVLKPFAADVPMSCAVLVGGAVTTKVTVDHVVTGTGLQLVVRNPDGEPEVATVDSLAAAAGGTELTLLTAVTCAAGAPAVVGKVAKLTETYQCVSIGMAGDLQREVRGVQWVPEVFEPIAEADFGTDDPTPGVPQEQAAYAGPPMAADLAVVPDQDGGHLVTWTRIDTGRRARVWVQDAAVGTWSLVAEVPTGNAARVRMFSPWRSYTVAVSLGNAWDTFSAPEVSTQLSFTAEEFPAVMPPAARRLQAWNLGPGLLLAWEEQDGRELAYFELRAGRSWASATPLYRGRQAQVLLATPRICGTYQVAPRWRNGLFGARATVTPAAAWTPDGLVQKASRDELSSTPGGTLTDLTYNGTSDQLELSTGKLTGTYLTLELDPGSYVGPWYWQVRWDSEELDDTPIDDVAGNVDSGEAAWRTVDTRPASVGLVGVDFDDLVDDFTALIDDTPDDVLVGVNAGEPGENTEALVESRFHDGSSWGAWRPHRDGVVTAQKMQVRVTLRRQSTSYQRNLVQLDLRAFI